MAGAVAISKTITRYGGNQFMENAVSCGICAKCDSPCLLSLGYKTKVSLKKLLEGFSMSSFISCHLMNGVMDCIRVSNYCSLSGGRHGMAFEELLKKYSIHKTMQLLYN